LNWNGWSTCYSMLYCSCMFMFHVFSRADCATGVSCHHVQLNCTELLSTTLVTKISLLIFDKGICIF